MSLYTVVIELENGKRIPMIEPGNLRNGIQLFRDRRRITVPGGTPREVTHAALP